MKPKTTPSSSAPVVPALTVSQPRVWSIAQRIIRAAGLVRERETESVATRQAAPLRGARPGTRIEVRSRRTPWRRTMGARLMRVSHREGAARCEREAPDEMLQIARRQTRSCSSTKHMSGAA